MRSCRLCAVVGHLEDADHGWANLSGGPSRTARLVAATRLLPVVQEIATCNVEKFPFADAGVPLSPGLQTLVKARCVAMRDALTSLLDAAREEVVTSEVARLTQKDGDHLFELKSGLNVALLPPRPWYWISAPTAITDPLRKMVIQRIVRGKHIPTMLPSAPRSPGSHLPSFSRGPGRTRPSTRFPEHGLRCHRCQDARSQGHRHGHGV